MKNNFKKLIPNILLCLPILLADTGVCLADTAEIGSNVVPFNTILIKFGITMGSVLVSLLVIWSVLYNYKRIMQDNVKEHSKKSLYGDSLKSPISIDGAVISFINKNRL